MADQEHLSKFAEVQRKAKLCKHAAKRSLVSKHWDDDGVQLMYDRFIKSFNEALVMEGLPEKMGVTLMQVRNNLDDYVMQKVGAIQLALPF